MTGVVDSSFNSKVEQHATTEMQATAADLNKRFDGTVAKLAMRQPFVLFKGLTFQNSAYGRISPGITIIKC
ncbi:hypothetical protein BANRA_05530 [Klebsiella pneumoniae]|nr:hypothetical protein BANRA_05530 [Klebsiella pneumoniae]